MSILFEPFRIGRMEIRNRFVHSATHEGMADKDHRVNHDLVKRYETLSKGEVGLIIPGILFVHPLGRTHKVQCGIHSDETIPGLKKITQAVHEHGGKIAFQLAHGGRQTPKALIGHPPLAPSAHGLDPVSLNKPRQMTETQIEETIDAFVRAAHRAVAAEADAVQLHSAHGYLLNEFLSPFFNRRRDAWGGSDENRFRFISQIASRIKTILPEGMPLLVKINVNDYISNKGITPALASKYIRWLVDLGVDAVEISCGTYYSFHTIRGDVPVEEITEGLPAWMRPVGKIKMKFQARAARFCEAYNLDAAKIIKPVMGKTPLILVGGMRRLAQMEEVIKEGHADLISMSRPLIREPFLVKRFKEDRATQASCISCNKCFAAIFNGRPVRCYQK
jgi:2,4-dienoyl-CoA reductase-like NADH-dependent reductase (Old Yellow Enzyme family)